MNNPTFLIWFQLNQEVERESTRERERQRENLDREITWSTTYQSLNLGYLIAKQSAIFSPLFGDPNLPLSPLVPADSNQAKKKAMFSGFLFVHQHYAVARCGEEEGSCLWLPLPSWCSIQHSRFGSTTVTTLAHGCEEATRYLLFADRHRESSEYIGPFLLDTYHEEAFC